MFPNPNQDVYRANPSFLFTRPVVKYPARSPFFYQQHLNSHHIQSLYKDEQLYLNNALEYYKKQEITTFSNYRQDSLLTLPQREFKNGVGLNNDFLNSKNVTNNININENNRSKSNFISIDLSHNNKNEHNRCNSNFISIDLSNIKILPPQEKLSLEELEEPRRKNKRWTIEEDQLLSELKKNHQLSWREIASNFPARTLKACQFRISKLKHTKNIKAIRNKTSNLIS